jgi:hypothetical protein
MCRARHNGVEDRCCRARVETRRWVWLANRPKLQPENSVGTRASKALIRAFIPSVTAVGIDNDALSSVQLVRRENRREIAAGRNGQTRRVLVGSARSSTKRTLASFMVSELVALGVASGGLGRVGLRGLRSEASNAAGAGAAICTRGRRSGSGA